MKKRALLIVLAGLLLLPGCGRGEPDERVQERTIAMARENFSALGGCEAQVILCLEKPVREGEVKAGLSLTQSESTLSFQEPAALSGLTVALRDGEVSLGLFDREYPVGDAAGLLDRLPLAAIFTLKETVSEGEGFYTDEGITFTKDWDQGELVVTVAVLLDSETLTPLTMSVSSGPVEAQITFEEFKNI